MSHFFYRHRFQFFRVVLYSFFYSIFTALSVSIVMPFVNIIFASMPELLGFNFARNDDKALSLVLLCAGTWIVFLLKNLFHVLARRATDQIKHAATQEWREQFLSDVFSQSLDFFHRTPAGHLSARLFDTIEKVSEMKTAALFEFSRNIPLILLYGSLLVFISWKLMLLSLLLIPVVSWSNIFTQKLVFKAALTRQRFVSELMQGIQQKLYAIKMIKIFNSEKLEQEKFQLQNKKLKRLHRQKDSAESSGLARVEMIGVSAGVLLLYFVGMETLEGNFRYGPGGFVLFIAVVFSLIDPIKNSVKSWRGLQEADLMWNHIRTFFEDRQPPTTPTQHVFAFRDRIDFQNVSFQYEDRLPFLFERLNLKIHCGEKIALIGQSGIGKSTLMDLLVGLYKPTEGNVFLDGMPVCDIDRSDRARLFGVITQETFLFHDTVRNNVVYNLPGTEDKQVEEALAAVHLQVWLRQQSNGLDTVIGERGTTLSGGEKQRMALARMILRNPQILIFDEATSSLDLQTESLIHQMIMELFSARTIIFLSHRNSITRFADRTIAIRHKKVEELNRHALSSNSLGLC